MTLGKEETKEYCKDKKYDKEETEEYIKLQLPIIKMELNQVNNKITTYITMYMSILPLILSFSTLILMDDKINGYYYLLTIIPFVLVIWCVFKIHKLTVINKKLLKPVMNKKLLKPVMNDSEIKDIDIYNFTTYTHLTEEEFLSFFSYNKISELALKQIYFNSKLTYQRYKAL